MTLVWVLIFLDLTPKVNTAKAEMHKWDYIKLKIGFMDSLSVVVKTVETWNSQSCVCPQWTIF